MFSETPNSKPVEEPRKYSEQQMKYSPEDRSRMHAKPIFGAGASSIMIVGKRFFQRP
jgi:hypothetical protein